MEKFVFTVAATGVHIFLDPYLVMLALNHGWGFHLTYWPCVAASWAVGITAARIAYAVRCGAYYRESMPK